MKKHEAQAAFRVPPQAIEVEKHVIGAIFLDHEAIDQVGRVLTADDFCLERNSMIYRAAEALQARRVPCDLITVKDELQRQGTFDLAGGDSYLMELSAEVVSSANAAQHAEIVKEKAVAREVIRRATWILETAYAGIFEGVDLVERAEQEMYKAGDMVRGQRRGLVPMVDAVKRLALRLDAVAAGKSDRVRIGIPAIDDVMKGFRRGSLNILAARPGVGKSALALQASVDCGLPVAFFALEMTIEEEVERMIAQIDPSLNPDTLTDAAVVIAKRELLTKILTRISDYPIEICDETDMTPAYMRSECRRLKRKRGELGLIVADYLQIIKAERQNKRRDLEVGGISTDLKIMASDLNVPLWAVASLSRKCEERDNKRPIESDLREAGQIEFDAHSIIFLYRESKYSAAAKADELIKNVTEALIVKNRGGRTGKTFMDFAGAASYFHALTMDRQAHYANFIAGNAFNGPTKREAAATNGQSGAGSKMKKGPKGGTPSADWGKQTALIQPAGQAGDPGPGA